MIKFYDTCSLLFLQEDAFKEFFIISHITLVELENIKTASYKDDEIKWAARNLLKLLQKNKEKYNTIIYETNKFDPIIEEYGLINNNDSKIIATAYSIKNDILFITSDLACGMIAKHIGLKTEILNDISDDDYTGFKEIIMDEYELSDFYSNVVYNNLNPYDLKYNEYILIKDKDNKIIDKYKFNEIGKYDQIKFCKTKSKMFGTVVPKDDFQQIALDSLINNQITMLRGPAGSGKSYLAFGYMFELLEKGQIDKIIVFCNTVATKGSAKLGFYPGSRTEKLLDSQIGNLLESKLGDKIAVERLIDDGQLVLLPMSDIRGYDTTGMNAAVYISEAQNLNIELMRLALQRIGEDSICIIDGDYTHQVDMSIYAGAHNGMRRVSEIYKGQPFYGEIELQKIHRSKIAELAETL